MEEASSEEQMSKADSAVEGNSQSETQSELPISAASVTDYCKEEKESPETRKRKAEDRRTRKNRREKERRTEINNLFNTMVDEFNVPKELKADKNAILRAALTSIKAAKSKMDDADKANAIIAREVKEAKNRHSIVKASDSEKASQIITASDPNSVAK